LRKFKDLNFWDAIVSDFFKGQPKIRFHWILSSIPNKALFGY
jgi:hypothetical protein